MGKRVILYLFLLFSLSLQAQSEEKALSTNDSTRIDSTTVTQSSPFKRAIKKFMNFSDFDTLYISPNRYNYALMATHFSNFEYYSVTSEQPQPQKLSFSPNPHNKIGLYFGWRWIFLGWSVDVDDIYRKTNRKNRGTEFDLSLYSSKLGVDIFYRRTGNNYKIHKIRGFSEDIPSNYSEDFSGIKVDIKGLNLYYIFNNRKFSYPAAFSQSTNQRRNAGTFYCRFFYFKASSRLRLHRTSCFSTADNESRYESQGYKIYQCQYQFRICLQLGLCPQLPGMFVSHPCHCL